MYHDIRSLTTYGLQQHLVFEDIRSPTTYGCPQHSVFQDIRSPMTFGDFNHFVVSDIWAATTSGDPNFIDLPPYQEEMQLDMEHVGSNLLHLKEHHLTYYFPSVISRPCEYALGIHTKYPAIGQPSL